jgi:uncharacterized protein (TIGR03435 family)
MVVETIFWFHPLIWWMRTRLVDERERACDEEVLRLGNAPLAYAEGILEVCKSYVESPLVCVAGIGGADLRKRIESIMENSLLARLSVGKKLLIGAAGMFALIAPIMAGILGFSSRQAYQPAPVVVAPPAALPVASKPPALLATAGTMAPRPAPVTLPEAPVADGDGGVQAPPAPSPRFSTSSVKQVAWRLGGGAQNVTATGIDYRQIYIKNLFAKAWPMPSYQFVWPAGMEMPGGNIVDGWYDVSATMQADTTPEQLQLMFQSLLADHFNMSSHWETRNLDVYALKIASGGLRMQKSANPRDPNGPYPGASADGSGWHWKSRLPREAGNGPSGLTLSVFLATLNGFKVDLPVVDQTGLEGYYDLDLNVARDPGVPWPTQRPNDGWNTSTFKDALETQLGLTLVPQTLPTRMLIIDSLDLSPKPN